ncbi:MAG: type II toxin-antitoxin system RelE/ParE family toxin [Sphingobacteriaceae bacterium]
MKTVREIIFYGNHFEAFYHAQNRKVKDKIDEVLFMITIIERVPSKFLQHLAGTDGLYEIRIGLGSNIFRVFCCFDEGYLVVLFNGFQKKSQKTPANELERAERLKEEYFKEKNHG